MWERDNSGSRSTDDRRLMTDGGVETSGLELGAVVIGIVSILYFLMNLLGALAYIGLTGASSSLGDSGGALFGIVAIVVSLALMIGFLAGPIGVFTGSPWGWLVTAGAWALNLVWGLLLLVTNGFNLDVLNLVFLAINLAVLGYIYTEKMDDVAAGRETVPA